MTILELLGILIGSLMWLFAVSQGEKRAASGAVTTQSERLGMTGPRGALQRLVGERPLEPGLVRDDHYPFDLWHVGVYRGRTLRLRLANDGSWELAIRSPAAAYEVLEPDHAEFAELSAELCSSPQSTLEAQPEAHLVKLYLREPFSEARLEELAPPLRRVVELLEQGRSTEAPVVEPAPPLRLTSEREVELRCPYCHDGLQVAGAFSCEGCGTHHHQACYSEAGCTVLGCRGATRARPPTRHAA